MWCGLIIFSSGHFPVEVHYPVPFFTVEIKTEGHFSNGETNLNYFKQKKKQFSIDILPRLKTFYSFVRDHKRTNNLLSKVI